MTNIRASIYTCIHMNLREKVKEPVISNVTITIFLLLSIHSFDITHSALRHERILHIACNSPASSCARISCQHWSQGIQCYRFQLHPGKRRLAASHPCHPLATRIPISMHDLPWCGSSAACRWRWSVLCPCIFPKDQRMALSLPYQAHHTET